MRSPMIPLLLGATFVTFAFVVVANLKSSQDNDIRGIAALRRTLDTTRAALVAAATADDSTRLRKEISEREYYLGRRAYHLQRQERIDGWWRLTGPGTLLLALGAALIGMAAWLYRRAARGST